MFKDISIVMWKEIRTILRFQGRRGQLIFSILPPIIMAIFFPWSLGLDWANLYLPLFITVFIPLLVVAITVPDSFAGERERHTLETLLGSRLPDKAILFGKLLVSVVGGWGMSIAVLFISITTLNIVHWQGRVIFYRPIIFLSCLAIGLMISILASALGVLFSMRAPTVQAAQQNLLTWLMLPPMLLGFVPLILFSLPDEIANRLSLNSFNSPNRVERIRQFINGINGDLIVWFVIGVLFLIASSLLLITLSCFRRTKLILD